jgi:hypothetical protein
VGPVKLHNFLRLVLLALLLAQQSVFALLNFDGTRNQLFVFGSVALAYDSNIFAQPDAANDFTESLTVGTDIKRRAGLIAVNTTASVEFQRFNKHGDLNAINPSLLVVFEKSSGRLTGALTVNAYRTEQADSAVNLRTTSWVTPVDLSLRYPINEKFYATADTTYQQRRYVDNTAGLSNYRDFSEGIDGFYVYTSKLDFLGGYRVRFGRTDVARTTDHNFSIGATGGLLPKVTGLVRFGYQVRQVNGLGSSFDQFSALGQLTWNASRKLGVGAQFSRDFSTTATAISVDAATAAINANYTLTRRFEVQGSMGYGRNRYLGQTGSDRIDEFFSWNGSATYSLNEHLKFISSFSYFRNQSNLSQAEFNREQLSLTVSSRF